MGRGREGHDDAGSGTQIRLLKNDMVTKQVFASLEERVAALEIGGIGNSEVTFLKKEVHRLDSSSKCLCFSGFQDTSAASRSETIKKILKEDLGNPQVISFEHIWTGPPGKQEVES